MSVLTAFLFASGPAPPVSPPSLPPPRGYVCVRAQGPVTIDGRLDDDAWNDAPWTEPFVDIEGDPRPRPRFLTRAKMLWDDHYFYVAALLEEPDVWATLTKHDSVIFHDNDFELFIDPDGDNHEYYELEINALNTEWDLFLKKPYRDGGPALDAWEIPGLKTATHINGTLNDSSDRDTGWSVELAIPWQALGEYAHRPAPPRHGDRWRVNFSRVEWEVTKTPARDIYKKVPGRPEANWVWSPQGVVDMHRPERWGYVQFSTEAAGRGPFQPDPTLPARDLLMSVYHAERAYRDRHKSWSTSLDALGLGGVQLPTGVSRLEIRTDGDGFEARVTIDNPAGPPRRTVTVREDSRLLVEPKVP